MKLKHALYFVYAAGGYAVGLVSTLYLLGFIAGFGVPKDITDGHYHQPYISALINLGLTMLFGLHHSLTARSRFKRWWVQFIPAPIERATYLYMTAVMTTLLIYMWQPIPIVLWQLDSNWAIAVVRAAYLATWGMMIMATFHFGHFEFFGIAQVWRILRNTPPPSNSMSSRYLYALVRHPIGLGWMITPWLVPTLTVGHLVFAAGVIIYIILSTPFEESDLVEHLGEDYIVYKKRIPAFLPFIKHSEK